MNSKIVIIEGMSTSGKTTVMRLVTGLLREHGIDCKGFDELKTVNREIFSHVDPKISIQEMREFLQKECSTKGRVVICDRFHLSHLAITNGSDNDFEVIEKEISGYNPLLVLLMIPEDKVKERLLWAKGHRGKQWDEELEKRGQTEDGVIEWFKGTQRNHLRQYQKSNLPKLIFDTGTMNFQEISEEICRRILEKRA